MKGEKARLRQEIEEYAELTGRLSRLLTLTANALKGEPADNVWHDWSDLPAVAVELVGRVEEQAVRLEQLDQYASVSRGPTDNETLLRRTLRRQGLDRDAVDSVIALASAPFFPGEPTAHEAQSAAPEKRIPYRGHVPPLTREESGDGD